MLKNGLVVMMLMLVGFSKAQVNLVPNWSFEEQDSCQTIYYPSGSNIYYTHDWFSPFSFPTGGGAVELYSACATIPYFVPPQTLIGYQQPFDGNNYAGFFLSMSLGREYIEVGLTDS